MCCLQKATTEAHSGTQLLYRLHAKQESVRFHTAVGSRAIPSTKLEDSTAAIQKDTIRREQHQAKSTLTSPTFRRNPLPPPAPAPAPTSPLPGHVHAAQDALPDGGVRRRPGPGRWRWRRRRARAASGSPDRWLVCLGDKQKGVAAETQTLSGAKAAVTSTRLAPSLHARFAKWLQGRAGMQEKRRYSKIVSPLKAGLQDKYTHTQSVRNRNENVRSGSQPDRGRAL